MKQSIRVYPHNDLFNLAFFNLENINKKVEKGEREGLALDCINCLAATAFSVEALFNYVGFREIDKWNEKASWHVKAKQLHDTASLKYDESIDPIASLILVKNIRNDLAHGKPIERLVEADDEVDDFSRLEAAWDRHCNSEFANQVFEQARGLRELLFDAYNIEFYETLTGSSIGRLS